MDYLDELIEASKTESKEFAQRWEETEIKFELALLRKKAGLTQQEVADKMGIARPRIAELEARPGHCSFNRIREYVKAVGGGIRFESSIPSEIAAKPIDPQGGYPATFKQRPRKPPITVREQRKSG